MNAHYILLKVLGHLSCMNLKGMSRKKIIFHHGTKAFCMWTQNLSFFCTWSSASSQQVALRGAECSYITIFTITIDECSVSTLQALRNVNALFNACK